MNRVCRRLVVASLFAAFLFVSENKVFALLASPLLQPPCGANCGGTKPPTPKYPPLPQCHDAVCPIPAEYFGMHVSTENMEPNPIVPIGSQRVFQITVFDPANSESTSPFQTIGWNSLNPQQNIFKWNALDFIMGMIGGDGIWDRMFTFYVAGNGGPDPFFAEGPNGTVDIDAWTRFLTNFVTRYKGQIHYLELFNEPNSKRNVDGTPNWPVSTYVQLAQAAYKTVKAIDPEIQIVAPTVTYATPPGTAYAPCESDKMNFGDVWLACFLQLGGTGTFDVFAFHGYWKTTHPDSSAPFGEDFMIEWGRFDDVLSRRGVHVPVWDTEASFLNFDNDASDRPAAIAKYYLLHWAQGISRYYWFTYDDEGWIDSNLTGFRLAPSWNGIPILGAGVEPSLNPTGVAYSEVFKWMVGATMTKPCFQDDSTKTWSCGFERPDGSQTIALWNSVAPQNFEVPAGYKYVRRLDGSAQVLPSSTLVVGNLPVLIESTFDSPSQISNEGGLGNTGSIDAIYAGTGIAEGQASDPAAPGASVVLQFYADGPAGSPGAVFIGAGRTDASGKFSFQLPPAYWDGKTHELYAYSFLNSQGNQGKLFLVNGGPRPFKLQSGSPWQGTLSSVAYNLTGGKNGELVTGSAWNSLDPAAPITVYVYLDGPANRGGIYLGSTSVSPSNHGFSFQIPNMTKYSNPLAPIDPAASHTVYVHPGSPKNPPLARSGWSFTQK